MIEIRTYRPSDLDALYAISLATGHGGKDASHLYDDPRLMGHIYAAPYAILNPDLVLVAADEQSVVGYAAGTTDTVSWQAELERSWWPTLRAKYAFPGELPSPLWSPDQRRAFIIHKPETCPRSVAHVYPAHLHLNLLPKAQGQKLGSALFETWYSLAAKAGASSVHIGTNRTNSRSFQFWSGQGFKELNPEESLGTKTVWMGKN